MKPNVNNRVIVRVWTSGVNQVVPGVNVGHISVEMPDGGYVSLWPTRAALGFADEVPYQLLDAYEADYQAENRKPELTICLYSLETAQMREVFEEERKQLASWTLIMGSPFFERFQGAARSHSCASLALKVLKAGGLEILAKTLTSTEEESAWFYPSKKSNDESHETMVNDSATSPESVLGLVVKAKVSEVQQYPHTKTDYYSPHETPFDELKSIVGRMLGLASPGGKITLVAGVCKL